MNFREIIINLVDGTAVRYERTSALNPDLTSRYEGGFVIITDEYGAEHTYPAEVMSHMVAK